MKDQVVGLELEKQVTSLELSKELRKLGVKQDSLWYWTWAEWNGKTEWVLIPWERAIKLNKETYSAFTVAELGIALPIQTTSENGLKMMVDFLFVPKVKCIIHLRTPKQMHKQRCGSGS